MKIAKTLDLWISIILILLSLVFGLVSQDEKFLYGYFVVGGWQVISMLYHTYNKIFTTKGSKRRNYHIIVATIIFLGLTIFIYNPIAILLLYILLFVAPVMAIYYTYLCYTETYIKLKRPLDALK